jgi:Tfp pilus assembly protein PilO
MKELVGKFISKMHFVIMLYAAWSLYGSYEEHAGLLVQITDQKPGLEQEIQAAQKKLEKIKEFRENIDQTKAKVNEVFSKIEKVQRQLPSDISDIEILDYIIREGRGLNIPEIEPNPLPEQPLGFYISKPFKIRGRGTFLQFVIFLERLNSADRIFNVKSLNFKADDQPQKGRFQVINMDLMIDTFKYNMAHSETSGVDEIVAIDGKDETVAPKRRKRE